MPTEVHWSTLRKWRRTRARARRSFTTAPKSDSLRARWRGSGCDDLGADASSNTGLAWLYVALRIAHSLVQAMINIVMLRFAIFMAATIVLLVMSIRAALIVF
jgi:hypothetical protein